MKKGSCYRVDYHVILVSYFALENPLSAAPVAAAWSRLRTLGGLYTETSIIRRGVKSVDDVIRNDTELGSARGKEQVLKHAETFSSFFASAVRPDAGNAILDSDVNFSYTPDEAWNGEKTGGNLHLSISGQVVERVGVEAVLEIFHQIFQIAGECHSHYGLVDIARPYDAGAGGVFGCSWPASAPLQRKIDQNNWAVSGALKGDRARGLYWGNYFGPAILERLGGRERFLEDFRRTARLFDGSPNSLLWEFSNGIFASLCRSVLDMRPGESLHPSADKNVRWLCEYLGTRGVLNPW